MYTVATYLVERKSGISFVDFLRKYFFGPLEMNSISLQPEAARAKGLGDRITAGYIWDADLREYKEL